MQRLLVVFTLLFVTVSEAADLGQDDAGLIAAAGIPIYSEAVFAFGSKDVGFRFASDKPIDEVRAWYRSQLPQWSLYQGRETWHLYDGPADAAIPVVFRSNSVTIKRNDKLPAWHRLDSDMTTEIVIMIWQ